MKSVSIKVLVPIKDVIAALGTQHELVPKSMASDARKITRDMSHAAFMEAAQALSEAVERLDDVAYTRDERRALEAVVKSAKSLRKAFRTLKLKEMTNGS